MITELTLFVAHNEDDWEYGNLMEGLDQQEAYYTVESEVEAEDEDGEAGVRMVLTVRYREEYQLHNFQEEIDQSEASAFVEAETLKDSTIPDPEDDDFPSPSIY